MKKNIYLRLILIAALAIFATFFSITMIYYGMFREQVRADLANTARLLRDTGCFMPASSRMDLNSFFPSSGDLRVTWIGKKGQVLYDNDVTWEVLNNHLDRPEVRDAMKYGSGESVRQSDTLKSNTFYYALLLSDGTVLRVSTTAQSRWALFLSASPILVMILLAIMGLCLIISRFMTRRIVRPIENMARNLNDLDYEAPYRELNPFTKMLRSQHADILAAAQARQDFTANVSHELKTPLTAISGYAELLESGVTQDKQRHHFYREIIKNAQRLLALINDILRLSDLDRPNRHMSFEELDLCEVMKECQEALTLNAKARDISINFSGEQALVRGSRDLLKELIENLVQNAIRYNNPGGRVNVIVSSDDVPRLIVRDNGIGIAVADQSRVFERFYRVDKSRSKLTGGTGLGLAIVKHIVELHGAKLELDSALGVGTTVTVVF